MIKMSENLTLKACRIIANVKAEELAVYVGVTVDTIYKWERGKSLPDLLQMRKIIEYLAKKGYAVDMNEINFLKS